MKNKKEQKREMLITLLAYMHTKAKSTRTHGMRAATSSIQNNIGYKKVNKK